MKTDRDRKNAAVVVVRWSARVLGLIFAGFLLLMFIGQSLESGLPLKSIEPVAAVGLALMGIYTVAMLLAPKWERLGYCLGGTALGGFFVMLFLGLLPGNVSGGFSTRGVMNPIFLAFWLPIVLYLLCWRLEKKGEKRTQAAL
jgi:heme A synthase